jgi:hypothetical protein
LYADDTSIIVTDRDVSSVFNRAPVLFSLFSTWFINNRLALNSKKTNFVLFSLKHLASPCDITFDLYTVHKVDNVKYLGFFLDERLSWVMHLSHVKSQVTLLLSNVIFLCLLIYMNIVLR